MKNKSNYNLCTKRQDCIEKAMKHFSTSTVEKIWNLPHCKRSSMFEVMNWRIVTVTIKRRPDRCIGGGSCMHLTAHKFYFYLILFIYFWNFNLVWNQISIFLSSNVVCCWTTFDIRQLEFLFLLSGLKNLMKKINHNHFSTSYINDHIFLCLFPPINLQPITHLEAVSLLLRAGCCGASIIFTQNLLHVCRYETEYTKVFFFKGKDHVQVCVCSNLCLLECMHIHGIYNNISLNIEKTKGLYQHNHPLVPTGLSEVRKGILWVNSLWKCLIALTREIAGSEASISPAGVGGTVPQGTLKLILDIPLWFSSPNSCAGTLPPYRTPADDCRKRRHNIMQYEWGSGSSGLDINNLNTVVNAN
ncbi:hypothetical protein VP01_1211g1 [Puccinia sorghi]|uniref:Uncharacterized protein n=1 Tax=Puccinia sorghi TaxID=27349 RepID=A0A0L6VQA9_9BASI|nr:hypothetical protein VP01_1211g1 [Puccinia sorghi]